MEGGPSWNEHTWPSQQWLWWVEWGGSKGWQLRGLLSYKVFHLCSMKTVENFYLATKRVRKLTPLVFLWILFGIYHGTQSQCTVVDTFPWEPHKALDICVCLFLQDWNGPDENTQLRPLVLCFHSRCSPALLAQWHSGIPQPQNEAQTARNFRQSRVRPQLRWRPPFWVLLFLSHHCKNPSSISKENSAIYKRIYAMTKWGLFQKCKQHSLILRN